MIFCFFFIKLKIPTWRGKKKIRKKSTDACFRIGAAMQAIMFRQVFQPADSGLWTSFFHLTK
jgi:hypothetical protein